MTGSTFTVPARSAIVAVDKAGYESAGIKSSNGKVKVNYVYEATGEKLEDSVILQGSVGSGYVTVPSAVVPDTYIVSRIEEMQKANILPICRRLHTTTQTTFLNHSRTRLQR